MTNSIQPKNWGRSIDGTIHHGCVECGTSSKKHRGNGLCETCYGRYKERRKEQRRKERKQSDKLLKIKKFQDIYEVAEKLKRDEEAKLEEELAREKIEFPLVIEYIDYLFAKLHYFPSFEVICPICATKYFYENVRSRYGIRSPLTNSACPKCKFDPARDNLEQICWICQKRMMDWGEDYCDHCKKILAKKTIAYFQKYCPSCNNPVNYDNCHWEFSFENHPKKTIQICDNCKEKIDQKKFLAVPENSADYFKSTEPTRLKWVEITNGEVFGIGRPHLALFFLTPNYALKYLRESNYRDKNFILNIVSVSGSSLKGIDLAFSPPKNSFASKHKKEILERLDYKILLWESEHSKNFVRNYSPDSEDKFTGENVSLMNDNFSIFNEHLFKIEIETLINRNVIVKKPYTTEDGLVIYSTNIKKITTVTGEIVSEINNLLIECENEIRFENGIPEKGKGWVSESEIFHEISEICNSLDIKAEHHSKPVWLGLQHLDVYVPSKKIAIEYQGTQHFKPVDFFGGLISLKETQERDRKKAKLCKDNNVKIIYINETDTEEELQNKKKKIYDLLKN